MYTCVQSIAPNCLASPSTNSIISRRSLSAAVGWILRTNEIHSICQCRSRCRRCNIYEISIGNGSVYGNVTKAPRKGWDQLTSVSAPVDAIFKNPVTQLQAILVTLSVNLNGDDLLHRRCERQVESWLKCNGREK